MHVHCLHWVMSTALLFNSGFCRPFKSTTGFNGGLQFGSELRSDMAPTLSIHLSRPCSGILALVGTCTRHSHSKLYYCVILLPCCHHPPQPCVPPTHPLIYAGLIVMNFTQNCQKLTKISHYLLARLVVQKL